MRLSHLQQLQYFEDRAEKEPDFWPGILLQTVSGESLKEIAAEWLCLGVVLREWIKRDDDREQAYQEALERKREMHSEALLDRTAAAAFASVQDAQTGSGDWLDVQMWPKGLLAAADTVEFGPDGRPYKIKMDAGKHGDRLARMLGMDKTGQTNVNLSMSLIGVLSEMPAAAKRALKTHDVSDAEEVAPKLVTDAPELAEPATTAARSSLAVQTPGRSVNYEPI
jgi:hypothetical protein